MKKGILLPSHIQELIFPKKLYKLRHGNYHERYNQLPLDVKEIIDDIWSGRQALETIALAKQWGVDTKPNFRSYIYRAKQWFLALIKWKK